MLNTSHKIQSVSLKVFPSLRQFNVDLEMNSRIAPGMSVTATITYAPEVYKKERDFVTFKSNDGTYN